MGEGNSSDLMARLKEAGVDVDGTLRRFCGNEVLYRRFLMKFLEDKTFEEICPKIDQGEADKAFQLVHTLKGVTGNLGLTRLYEASISTTEFLRVGDHGGAVASYAELKEAYDEIVALLRGEGGRE